MEKDAREKLLEVAGELFAHKGYAAVTIRELSEAAGANSALISYYFGGKEGLYAALLETYYAKGLAMLKELEAVDPDPMEAINRYALIVANVHRSSPYLIRLMFGELSNPTPCFETVIKPFIMRAFGFLHQAIRRGIAQGQFRREIDPAYAAISLAGIMNFYFLVKALAGHALPVGEQQDELHIQQALTIYLTGITQPQGGGGAD